MDSYMIGALVGASSALLSAGIAQAIFKNSKYRQTLTGLLFVVIFIATKSYILPYYYAYTFESYIKQEHPVFQTIAQFYPEQFRQYIDEEKKIILAGGTRADTTKVSANLESFALMQSLPFASPESIFRLINASLQADKKLYEKNPIWVLVVEFPARGGIEQADFDSMYKSFSQADFKEKLQAENEVIESGSRNRQPLTISEADANIIRTDIQDIITTLKNQYGDAAVANTFSSEPFADPKKSAQILISLYEAIVAKGEQRGGMIGKVFAK